MLAWRISRKSYAALDGEGARLFGGRWSSPGTSVVYASSHLSLSALEYLVDIDIDDAPSDLVAIGIELPDDARTETLAVDDVPDDWRSAESIACRSLGDGFMLRGDALLLRVPSVLIPEETNLLLNPGHSRFSEARVVVERAFSYDPRLL